MHARLDHRLPQPLRAQAALDRGEDLVVGQRERVDVGAVEIDEFDGGHPGIMPLVENSGNDHHPHSSPGPDRSLPALQEIS